MRNIAILIPTLKKGGAEKQAVLLKVALEKRNYKVYFILFNSELGIENELLLLGDFKQSELYLLKGSLIKKMIRLALFLRKSKVEILFSYLTATNLWGCLLGRLCGVDRIYPGIRNAYLEFPKRLSEQLSALLSTKVIFNNYRGLNIFPKFIRKKAIVIPNCYINFHNVQKKDETHEFINIITVARFTPQKDYLTALKSIKIIIEKGHPVYYTIIGYGDEEAAIRQWIDELDLNNYVKVIINPQNIFKYLCESDIYLSTSLYEGTSNSIMEALDAELPIVATNVGDNDKLVKEGINGYLNDIQDFKGIADNIERLIIAENSIGSFGKNSKQLLRDNYSFEIYANSYYKLLDEK
ncbi:MAG: glycosyltransferase [Duncaniella sp.]|uniref:glycosyltransferase n=1 Tax=Duncaniella sp. TaxID=2518496 RepID=UPI0023CEA8DB|nr:glycosyltransferase [Duncaniella sp.]MDE6091221.1 glycosyltransferase [Duncaniella sp.]